MIDRLYLKKKQFYFIFFEVGKSIVENIVDSIDTSRKCLLVVSKDYLQSSWCMFEAHLANNRLIQVRFSQN